MTCFKRAESLQSERLFAWLVWYMVNPWIKTAAQSNPGLVKKTMTMASTGDSTTAIARLFPPRRLVSFHFPNTAKGKPPKSQTQHQTKHRRTNPPNSPNKSQTKAKQNQRRPDATSTKAPKIMLIPD